jgi:hypothetical protein
MAHMLEAANYMNFIEESVQHRYWVISQRKKEEAEINQKDAM